MNKLMMTAAASAFILAAAACSNEEDVRMTETSSVETTDSARMSDTDMADTMDERDPAPVETVYLTSGEFSADELIGSEVTGVDGTKIATVDDLLINSAGTVESVIFRSGDFVDIVGTKGALAFDQLDLTMTAGEDSGFSVGMTEDAIQQIAEFDQEGLNDYRLASEMIGTTAGFMNSGESARINDIILDENGKARFVIVGDTTMMGDERQLAFDQVSVDQMDGDALMIDASADDLKSMPLFKYEREMDDMSDPMGDDMTDPMGDYDTGMDDTDSDTRMQDNQ